MHIGYRAQKSNFTLLKVIFVTLQAAVEDEQEDFGEGRGGGGHGLVLDADNRAGGSAV